MSGRIECAREGHIATVTIANAERRNALSSEMWEALGTVFRKLSADDDVRCIILTGEGDRAFASGADISTFQKERKDLASGIAYGRIAETTIVEIANCRHPIVAAIQGACVGGGLEVAVLCDIRISGKSGRFGIPAMKLGLNVSLAELPGLLAVVGQAVALEILLEGRLFGADEAFQKRLVNRVVEDGAVMQEARESAQRIAAGAPLVARWHKQFVRRLQSGAAPTQEEIVNSYACFGTEDFQIGTRAFLAKEQAIFTGR
jgi:enoyl-CoA hydratase